MRAIEQVSKDLHEDPLPSPIYKGRSLAIPTMSKTCSRGGNRVWSGINGSVHIQVG